MASTDGSMDRWLLDNQDYLRSVSRASGAGGYRISLPKTECDDLGIDRSDQLVVLPSDVAGQLGLTSDPVFEVYELPLERGGDP